MNIRVLITLTPMFSAVIKTASSLSDIMHKMSNAHKSKHNSDNNVCKLLLEGNYYGFLECQIIRQEGELSHLLWHQGSCNRLNPDGERS